MNATQEFSIPQIPLTFLNTETKKKEVFKPLIPKQVKMYTCGPTIYNFAHIGNFRTYVFEDLLRRTLKFFGYQVLQVMNLTDVDDKTIRGAIDQSMSLQDYVQPYKNAFFVDLNTLGIEPVEYYPAATEYISKMIDFIEKLLDKGFAYYSKDKSIYFSIAKSPKYGRLSHLKLEELKVGASDERVALDEYDKENAVDFVLWKAYDPSRDGKIYWESPFGPGRPGWHLECSCMAMSILGDTIDIHVGAVDNIFPHHENEIAQSEAFSGKLFVKMWLHSEHLLVNHKKMSKSLGNFYILRDLLSKGYDGMSIRYLLMQTHYRTQLNFTFESLNGAAASLQRINDFVIRVREIANPKGESSEEFAKFLQKIYQQFSEAMADDLNISVALSSLFELIHHVNLKIDSKELSSKEAYHVLILLNQINRVLGVIKLEKDEIPDHLLELLEKRQQARAEKQWGLADTYRQQITDEGYVIEDTPNGPRLKKMTNP